MVAIRSIEAPITVIYDNREKYPYEFMHMPLYCPDGTVSNESVLHAKREKERLANGDYTIAGLQSHISVERKTLSDLYSTLGNGQRRKRFFNELRRLNDHYESSAVVVEATIEQVQAGIWSQTIPADVCFEHINKARWLWPRILWHFVDGRRAGERACWNFLVSAEHRIRTGGAVKAKLWYTVPKDVVLPSVDIGEIGGMQ